MRQGHCIVVLCAALVIPVSSAAQTARGADEWRLVRALTSSSHEELTLERAHDRTERLALRWIVKVESGDPLSEWRDISLVDGHRIKRALAFLGFRVRRWEGL